MPPRPGLARRQMVHSFRPTTPSRGFASSAPRRGEQPQTAPPQRWLADLRARLGKCIVFGCTPSQASRAATVLQALATEWRALLAGSEGFLTGGRRGLEGHKVAWGEMDSFRIIDVLQAYASQQHVNNVTYVRYAESARVNWITNFAVHVDPIHRTQWTELMTPRHIGLIMRSVKADFKFPMTYPDTVSVYHKLRLPPSAEPAPTAFALDCIILSHRHRRVSARTEEDIVIYDYKLAKKTHLPKFMESVLEATYQEQTREQVRARTRIWDLIHTVETLEKETWNRSDAVEDLGSANHR